MIGIDLFAGAGGMSQGAAQAGVKTAVAVESDPFASKTYAANHSGTRVFPEDIRSFGKRHLGDIKRGREQTILFGGPPCQGFSCSNRRTRSSANPANWLLLEFVRVVKLWSPDWVVFENVKGIVDTEGGIFRDEVLSRLETAGYTVSSGVLDAVAFGVPQRRQRFFVIGSLHGVEFGFPMGNRMECTTVRDAIGDLPMLANGAELDWLSYASPPKSGYARKLRGRQRGCGNHFVTRSAPHILTRYAHVPPGGNWEQIPKRLMRNYADRSRCHTGIYHRLRDDCPSVVIGNFRKNMLIHPTQDRQLSVREAARIQSFPDWYQFEGSIGFQQQQVGNAVPPLLAEAVFRAVIAVA
jgi:DNA (cytosine-5)-methyltransferase 1